MNDHDGADRHSVGGVPGGGDDSGASSPRSIEGAPVTVRVNAVDIPVENGTRASVSELLRKAKDLHAIAGDPTDYILQTRSGETLNRGQEITVTPGEDLLAMPSGPTPVA